MRAATYETRHDERAGAAAAGSASRSSFLFAALQCLVLVAALLQCFIDESHENLLASAIVFASSTLCIQYLRVSRAFPALPMSSFALLGLCITTQWGALVAQSAAWNSLVEHLRAPISTFTHLAEYQAVAIFAHGLYRHARIARSARDGAAALARRAGLFDTPSVSTLWAMGFLGLAAQFLTGSQNDAIANLGIVTKIAQGFVFMAWAPFLLPVFHRRLGSTYCSAKRQYIGLAGYLLLAVFLGLALNFRGVMFFGIVTGLLLLALTALVEGGYFRRRQLVWLCVLTGLGTLAVSYSADVATAMAVARTQRGSIGAFEMVEETAYALADPYVVQRYRDAEEEATRGQLYDEYYFENSVVGRLVETKFHDNMFFLIEGLQPEQAAELEKETIERLWEILPRPLISLLGVSTQAEKVAETSSVGDYLVFLKYGGELGGFKTGSLFAHGTALFPTSFALWYGLACLLMFWQWDALTRRDGPGPAELSPLAMMLVLRCFMYGLTTESISSTASFVLRTYWQDILIYWLVYRLLEFAARGFGDRADGPHAPSRVAPDASNDERHRSLNRERDPPPGGEVVDESPCQRTAIAGHARAGLAPRTGTPRRAPTRGGRGAVPGLAAFHGAQGVSRPQQGRRATVVVRAGLRLPVVAAVPLRCPARHPARLRRQDRPGGVDSPEREDHLPLVFVDRGLFLGRRRHRDLQPRAGQYRRKRRRIAPRVSLHRHA